LKENIMSLVQAEKLEKSYRVGDVDVPAIRGVDFAIEAGGFVAFVGPSGSGKSTLLNLVGCLDHPSAGRLTVLGVEVAGLSRKAVAVFRGENLDFVFQDFNLVPVLSTYENIEYPLLMVRHLIEVQHPGPHGATPAGLRQCLVSQRRHHTLASGRPAHPHTPCSRQTTMKSTRCDFRRRLLTGMD
jgi:predicted ABC-type transport system involved in lysophospholipase L1 biosynthesis ATPase subunit